MAVKGGAAFEGRSKEKGEALAAHHPSVATLGRLLRLETRDAADYAGVGAIFCEEGSYMGATGLT